MIKPNVNLYYRKTVLFVNVCYGKCLLRRRRGFVKLSYEVESMRSISLAFGMKSIAEKVWDIVGIDQIGATRLSGRGHHAR